MLLKSIVFGACWLLAGSPLATAMPVPVPECPPQPAHYFCAMTLEAPVIDGDLQESAWEAAPWSDDFVDISKKLHHRLPWRTRMKMLWDENYLYVAAEIEEPHVWATLTERDAVIYHDNDFEVFIDPDGDNHLYYELEINALGTVWDLLLIKPYRDGAPAVNAWDIQGLKSAVKIDGTLNDPSSSDEGWSVELAFPWEVLAQCAGRPVPPAPDDIWRMNFSRVQWWADVAGGQYVKRTDRETGEPRDEENWVWSQQGLVAMHYPERWGEVMFVGAEENRDQIAQRFEENPEHLSILSGNSLMRFYYAQKNHHEEFGAYAPDLETLYGRMGECPLPEKSTLSANLHADRFEIRLESALGSATVDETGRLVRRPLKGKP